MTQKSNVMFTAAPEEGLIRCRRLAAPLMPYVDYTETGIHPRAGALNPTLRKEFQKCLDEMGWEWNQL